MKALKLTNRSNLILATLLVTAGIFNTSCTKEENKSPEIAKAQTPQSEEIKIGLVGSLTGGQASFGQSTQKGAEFAVNEINNGGGVAGKKLKLLSLDDQGKPEEAATVVTRLISQDKVTAILGEVASSISLAMAPIAQKNKIPMITPSSTNPKVTEIGDFIFRVCFIDPFQGSVMAKFATEDLKIKKVAVLTDVKNDYSVGLAQFFKDKFTSLGGKIVVEQSYSAGDMDFKSQLTSIKAKNPDAIYVPGYYTEVALIARQAKGLGLNVPLMGGDGWDSPKLQEIGGKAIEGSYFSSHYSAEDKSPIVQEFIEKFKKTYGIVPDALTALGYDAVKVLVEAMKRTDNLDTTKIRNEIASTKNYQGVTGLITIDEKRNPVKSAVVLKVVSTGFKYQTTVNP